MSNVQLLRDVYGALGRGDMPATLGFVRGPHGLGCAPRAPVVD